MKVNKFGEMVKKKEENPVSGKEKEGDLIISVRRVQQGGAAEMWGGKVKEMNHIWSHKYKPDGLNAMNI